LLRTAAPAELAQPMLGPPSGLSDYGRLMLELAGPYDESDGWYVLRSALEEDPTPSIRASADEEGRIDPATAARRLAEWGVESQLHVHWLTRDDKVRSINGALVRWDGAIGDRLAFALSELGQPSPAEALVDLLGEDRDARYAKNVMSSDARFIRANKTDWALSSWGLPVYSGIAASIKNLLEGEQTLPIAEIVRRIGSDFGTSESSILAYCDAPMFVVDETRLRLRRDDEPYIYDATALHSTPGVFDLGLGRVGLLYKVDGEVLRGSGRQLTFAAGAILGVGLNDRLTFSHSDGVQVNVTFPDSSLFGPSLGSTRALAEASNAKAGDYLTVVLDCTNWQATATGTSLEEHQQGWPLVARLTGIEVNGGMERLADALHCLRGEVRAVLRARGDDLVLGALPVHRLSPDLEEALAILDSEIGRDHPR